MADIRQFRSKANEKLPYLGMARNEASDMNEYYTALQRKINDTFRNDLYAPYFSINLVNHDNDNDGYIGLIIRFCEPIDLDNENDLPSLGVLSYASVNFNKEKDEVIVHRGDFSGFSEIKEEKDQLKYGDSYLIKSLITQTILGSSPPKYRSTIKDLILQQDIEMATTSSVTFD